MLIIGITGTIGAGKGTVVDYLINKYNFKHYSVRKYLTEMLLKEGKECNRDTFTALANSLREQYQSPSYIIEQLYEKARVGGENAIIESIRTVGEIDKLKSMGNFYLIAVDANQEIRYQRAFERKSETDKIDWEKFKEDELREMTSENPNSQNLMACMALADYKLQNNEEKIGLHNQVDAVMRFILG